jgi:hypothetical protein
MAYPCLTRERCEDSSSASFLLEGLLRLLCGQAKRKMLAMEHLNGHMPFIGHFYSYTG